MNNQQTTSWNHLISPLNEWRFEGNVLVHHDFKEARDKLGDSSRLQKLLVDRFWAVQRGSKVVANGLDQVLSSLTDQGWGLNIGAGHTRLHPKVLNVDLFRGDNIDVVTVGNQLPFNDSCIDCVFSQEVLEHVNRPYEVIEEAYRVLKPNGLFYCQVPFIIGYHPGPYDFWRFTKEGIRELFTHQPWEILTVVPTLGHGSGMYRILVEFMAINASILSSRLYKPSKGIFSVLFSPLRWLDVLTKYSKEVDRISGGYYCIARKLA